MHNKLMVLAATLTMMASAAVPAYAQNTLDYSDTDVEANDNNVLIAEGGAADASGGDGGDGGDQNGDINQDAVQYDNDRVFAGDVNGGGSIDTGAEQNVGDNTQHAGDGGDGGDGGIALGGDVVGWYYPFFGVYYPLFL